MESISYERYVVLRASVPISHWAVSKAPRPRPSLRLAVTRALQIQPNDISGLIGSLMRDPMLLIGLYTVELLAVVMTILTSVDSIGRDLLWNDRCASEIHALYSRYRDREE